jgi:hypothetical protein
MLQPKLTPVVHKTIYGLHRVSLREEGDEYSLQVDDNFVRRYDADTLPDEIKVRLAMIKAIPMPNLLHDDKDIYYNRFLFYDNNHSKDLNDVGWRVTKDLYCLVLPTTLLSKLKGER